MSLETRSYKSEKAKFATTHWSAVLRAAQSDHPGRVEAMEMLCRTYWYPVYAFVRRRGVNPADAQDCAQEFFQQLITGSLLKDVSPGKGRFRSYLLACCQHFLLNRWERERAQKRGGGAPHISLDSDAEDRFLQAAEIQSPENGFDREWALALFRRVDVLLADEYRAAGKGELCDTLHPHLSSAKELPTIDLAQKLGTSENHLHVLLHRLRQRYRELLRGEVAATLDDPADLKDEIRYLLKQLE